MNKIDLFWNRFLEKSGYEFTEEILVVFEDFEAIYQE